MPVRQAIIAAIPDGLKNGISISVGVFVLTIGLVLSQVVGVVQGHLDRLNLVVTPNLIAMLIGFAITVVLGLRRLKLPGGMLVGILAATIYARNHGIMVTRHVEVSRSMLAAVGKLDLIPSHLTAFLPVLLVFFLIDFYGSLGKFIGLSTGTSLIREGGLVRIERAMGTDAGGTILGAVLGTSSIITYVESAVGIAVGGRTGIVAIVCGLLMLASLAFAPLVGLVPVEATAGILVYVGYLLVRDTWANRDLTRFDLAVAAAMALISFLTFSLDKAMLCGFAAYSVASLRARRSDPILVVSAGLLLLGVLLPIWLARLR
jgi:AGZA family xanthine/uracil permease-like MFS transporter